MKKVILLLTSILILIYSTQLQFIKATAGAPKLVYEVVEGTTKSMIKAVEARKGFKVVEGGTDVAKPDNVVQMVGKSLQEGTGDAVKDAWTTIKGGKFDATPLKDKPGWIKVTLGTAAFITSADILLDIYNSFATNPNGTVDTIVPYDEVEDGFYKMDSILGWEVSVVWENNYSKFVLSKPDDSIYQTNFNINWFPSQMYIQVDPANKNKANVYATHPNGTSYAMIVPGRNPTTLEYVNSVPNGYTKDIQGLFAYYEASGLYFHESTGPMPNVPTNMGVVAPIKVPQFETYSTPEIDTSKQTQTLIIPDPAYHPDLDLAINSERDMVSNPEQWLRDNPQHDPNSDGTDGSNPPKEEEPTKEGEGTNPFKNLIPVAMLLALLDLLIAILMYLVRMFEFFIQIPMVEAKPIPNQAFIWFRDVTWLGIKPYSLVMTLGSFFMGFMAYKSIRRLFP